MNPQELSRVLTEAVAGLPAVRSVIPPGPALATLVRDVRTALDLPQDGGRVLVRDSPEGARVRVVVGVGMEQPALVTICSVRDAVVAAVVRATGHPPAEVTVRVVEID